MREQLRLFYHGCRMDWHWNRIKAKQARSGLSHTALMAVDASYRHNSICYNESRNVLIKAEQYVPAVSLIETV